MTHLRIEQNTTGIEEVSTAVINKLYELVSSGNLDSSSNLQGRLHVTSADQTKVQYLQSQFSQLYIQVDSYV